MAPSSQSLRGAAPRSLFSSYAPPLLSREQAKSIADKVLSFSKADETRVNISSDWSCGIGGTLGKISGYLYQR